MATRIAVRRDTTENWAAANPVLVAGEPALDTTTGSVRYGNGVDQWADLPVHSQDNTHVRDMYAPVVGVSSLTITVGTGLPEDFSPAGAKITRWDDFTARRWLTGTPTSLTGDPAAGGVTRTTGCDVVQPQMESFVYSGSYLLVHYVNYGPNCVTVYVDNQLAYKGYPTVASAQFLAIPFGSFGTHQVEVHYGLATPLYLWTHNGDSLFPGPARPVLGLDGDSYFESLAAGVAPDWGALGLALFERTGFAVVGLAQGSTGWVNQNDSGNASKQNYVGTARAAAAAAASPDLILVGGSVNDAENTALVAANVATYHSQRTGIPVVTLGVEHLNNGSAGYANNNAAVMAAAAAQPNSLGAIDWYSLAWQNGTGHTGGVVGDGNQDYIIGSDAIHPNVAGARHFARLIAGAMGQFVYRR